MHLLPAATVTLDEIDRAVDLDQPPGDVAALSFSDSDLAALSGAAAGSGLAVRLASLGRLRHPLSVDLYVEKTAARSRFVLVRCLGGLDYWRYGLERLGAACRAHNVPLAVLPGDDRDDERLAAYGTVEPALAAELAGFFRAGGTDNMRRLLARIGGVLGIATEAPAPAALPALFAWDPGRGPHDWREAVGEAPARPLALVLGYRSGVLAGDTATLAAMLEALTARGLAPLALALTSLKDAAVAAELAELIGRRRPAVIVTTTAFSARDGAGFVLDRADCPVIQAVPVGSSREVWAASNRGLSAADMAMQAALPEFDGRLSGPPVAFKREEVDPATGLTLRRFAPHAEGIAALAAMAAGWVRLAAAPPGERRLALILTDYPARGGRAGFAVGLDTPASAVAIHALLAGDGYALGPFPEAAALMPMLTEGPRDLILPLADYRAFLADLPGESAAAVTAAHGAPEDDPHVEHGAFRFRAVISGNLVVALQPGRDTSPDRKLAYHDPDVPPGHGYLAFYAALRRRDLHALVHLGTHGTTEWLPGKAVALSAACWPRLVTGGLPVIYPYVADDPGEAAPAKRRLAAVTVGHLPPPLAPKGGLSGEAALLRELVEEYSAAQTLDPRRADLIARDILGRAESSGLADASGVTPDLDMNAALARLDAHLCDLAETDFRKGFHVFGHAPHDPVSARGERAGLLAALAGRFVPPGPAGSPHRGRPDVAPTGRNLYTLDPRAVPTRAAAALGARAARAVLERHLQEEGDWPRRIVMDLWASPTLRSGGEDIAQALALMGAEPVWDDASTRVKGFKIKPLASIDHPRADVTVRISGAFRDTFPEQIALLDAAMRAVAALDEEDAWNEPAAARRRGEAAARIFGAAPGRYGAGVARQALDGEWHDDKALGTTYLAASGFAYGGADAQGVEDMSFSKRIAEADAFVHVSDVAGRDILEATSAADVIGGFAAAAALLGSQARAYSLDTTDPENPKSRKLLEDVSRIVHGRLTHPAWIAGQLAHGWRGAAELAEAVDAVFVYAATTKAVPDALFDALFTAYLADPAVAARIEAANAPAFAAIRSRLAEACRRGLWTSRLNSVPALLNLPPEEAA